VQVTRGPQDLYVEQVRVIVVRGDPPDYDSGWQAVPRGVTVLSHGLNWDPNLLMVRGECYAPSSGPNLPEGIHHGFAGGSHDSLAGWQGLHVQNLGRNSIEAVRRADDLVCPQVRVRIWRRAARVYMPLVVRNQ
jgi:hypothetical protein